MTPRGLTRLGASLARSGRRRRRQGAPAPRMRPAQRLPYRRAPQRPARPGAGAYLYGDHAAAPRACTVQARGGVRGAEERAGGVSPVLPSVDTHMHTRARHARTDTATAARTFVHLAERPLSQQLQELQVVARLPPPSNRQSGAPGRPAGGRRASIPLANLHTAARAQPNPHKPTTKGKAGARASPCTPLYTLPNAPSPSSSSSSRSSHAPDAAPGPARWRRRSSMWAGGEGRAQQRVGARFANTNGRPRAAAAEAAERKRAARRERAGGRRSQAAARASPSRPGAPGPRAPAPGPTHGFLFQRLALAAAAGPRAARGRAAAAASDAAAAAAAPLAERAGDEVELARQQHVHAALLIRQLSVGPLDRIGGKETKWVL